MTDQEIVKALLEGDEKVFEALIEQHYAAMLRVALMYLPERSMAEEAVQETWIHVLKGLPQFEGRSSLKTWIFSILINRAKTYARREGRHLLLEALDETYEPAVAPERFSDHDWAESPHNWDEFPEDRLISQETFKIIEDTLYRLPHNQREVMVLRDLQQWTSAEVCDTLGISEANQRVLLHRARSKVRQALEAYLKG